ncbi:MAG: DinB family protein [Isosphaeraceae bacterium]|nr:DinB family protein [Isosphaeraceae bacterium]
MSDPTLLILLDEVRGKTLRVLDGLTDAQARWAPPGLQNTILWHAGHSYVVVEWLTLKPLGREPHLPEGWHGMFSWDSRPAAVPADRWPPLAEVVGQLRWQHGRLRHLIAGLSAEQLAARVPDNPGRTIASAIVHGLHDEARHSGEISLLRKLQGLPGS